MTMTMTRLILCLGFAACVPPSTLPGAASPDESSPSCDFHATRWGNGCSCDSGYQGDGQTCVAEDTGPSCDAHASKVGSSCTCDIGYHGSGTFCSADNWP